MKISWALVQSHCISGKRSWTILPDREPRTSSSRSMIESMSTSWMLSFRGVDTFIAAWNGLRRFCWLVGRKYWFRTSIVTCDVDPNDLVDPLNNGFEPGRGVNPPVRGFEPNRGDDCGINPNGPLNCDVSLWWSPRERAFRSEENEKIDLRSRGTSKALWKVIKG